MCKIIGLFKTQIFQKQQQIEKEETDKVERLQHIQSIIDEFREKMQVKIPVQARYGRQWSAEFLNGYFINVPNKVESDDLVSSIVAHEMAHIKLGHVGQKTLSHTQVNALMLVMIFTGLSTQLFTNLKKPNDLFASVFAPFAISTYTGLFFAARMYCPKKRLQEQQADSMSLDYLTNKQKQASASDYDKYANNTAQQVAKFVFRIFFLGMNPSTHPSDASRAAAAQRSIKKMKTA